MNIRKGEKKDMKAVLDLIQELAAFEKEPNAVEVSASDLERDGFGNYPLFHTFVAEVDEQIVGIALYYYRYSTWKGKTVYLEDLLVTENFRKQGVGSGLLNMVLEHAKSINCQRVSWQVLDWNESAINFYKKFNATFDSEWLNCFIELR
ncbi:MAG: GNAT family N-acetyltransferase [Bacteroidia bacterium]|nr:GNAT family N-acetyltransferase [Bacteroidia bacterium]